MYFIALLLQHGGLYHVMFLFRFFLFLVVWFASRKRNITWYNPPWDANVKSNLGKTFLGIVDKCFAQNHPLHKIFNRHTLKLSYSYMPNMKTIIASHNKNILANVPTTTPQQPKECNCRNKTECPLDGKCLQQNLVYQATITTDAATESYVGLATNFRPLSATQTEETKLNYRNTFGLSKMQRNPSKLNGKF